MLAVALTTSTRVTGGRCSQRPGGRWRIDCHCAGRMMHDDLVDRDLAVVIQIFSRGGTSESGLFLRLEDHVPVLVILGDECGRPFSQVGTSACASRSGRRAGAWR